MRAPGHMVDNKTTHFQRYDKNPILRLLEVEKLEETHDFPNLKSKPVFVLNN